MELYKEILVEILSKEDIQVEFPNINIDLNKIIELECYKTLEKIKTVLNNGELSDFECIEEIVCLLENMGSNGGNRHDF